MSRGRRNHSSGKVAYNPFTHHTSKKDWSLMSIKEKELYLSEEKAYAKKLAIERDQASKKQIRKIIIYSSLALIVIALIVVIIVAAMNNAK